VKHPPRRKRFGQHFLHDPTVIDRIAAAINPRPGDHVVEIGPGRGALTRRLLNRRGSGGPLVPEASGPDGTAPDANAADAIALDAIEIDRDLAALLRREFAGHAGFALHEADALELNFTELAQARGGKLRVVGNLPYNISTPLLFHLLDHRAVIEDLHIMLQREVIARMAAKAGDDDYGRLTVMLAPWVSIEHIFDVGPGAFTPPPRVWSAVARLTVRSEPAFSVSEHFGAVVAAAFSHRRKTIRNALRELVTQEQIEAAGLDPGARPETFPPEAFNLLAQKIVRSTPSV
jgi:16S rRNA (adenine1518-N6/adenine1519-N6)-dimethyltransferase